MSAGGTIRTSSAFNDSNRKRGSAGGDLVPVNQHGFGNGLSVDKRAAGAIEAADQAFAGITLHDEMHIGQPRVAFNREVGPVGAPDAPALARMEAKPPLARGRLDFDEGRGRAT
jgi:hypothetical protein